MAYTNPRILDSNNLSNDSLKDALRQAIEDSNTNFRAMQTYLNGNMNIGMCVLSYDYETKRLIATVDGVSKTVASWS